MRIDGDGSGERHEDKQINAKKKEEKMQGGGKKRRRNKAAELLLLFCFILTEVVLFSKAS